MAEAIQPAMMEQGRRQFMTAVERRGVKVDSNQEVYVQLLREEAARGNPWARERYQFHRQQKMEAENLNVRQAEQDAYVANEAAYYTDTVGTFVTAGANRSLQRMADRAMQGDADGTMSELADAGKRVAYATLAAGNGQILRGAGVAIKAAGRGFNTAREGLQRTLSGVRLKPAGVQAPGVQTAGQTVPTAGPAVQAQPPVRTTAGHGVPEVPTTSSVQVARTEGLRYRGRVEAPTTRVDRYEPTGHDPGAGRWLEDMEKLRRMAAGKGR